MQYFCKHCFIPELLIEREREDDNNVSFQNSLNERATKMKLNRTPLFPRRTLTLQNYKKTFFQNRTVFETKSLSL